MEKKIRDFFISDDGKGQFKKNGKKSSRIFNSDDVKKQFRVLRIFFLNSGGSENVDVEKSSHPNLNICYNKKKGK